MLPRWNERSQLELFDVFHELDRDSDTCRRLFHWLRLGLHYHHQRGFIFHYLDDLWVFLALNDNLELLNH